MKFCAKIRDVWKEVSEDDYKIYKKNGSRVKVVKEGNCDGSITPQPTASGGIITPTPTPSSGAVVVPPTPSKTTCPKTTATEDDVKNAKEYIKRCVEGDIVTKIQKLLKKHGFHNISKTGEPDGVYGSRTEGSVEAFQREKKLEDDGIVGPLTWAELIKDKKVPPPTPTPTPTPSPRPDYGEDDNPLEL